MLNNGYERMCSENDGCGGKECGHIRESDLPHSVNAAQHVVALCLMTCYVVREGRWVKMLQKRVGQMMLAGIRKSVGMKRTCMRAAAAEEGPDHASQ
jgi:hypothetical protein